MFYCPKCGTHYDTSIIFTREPHSNITTCPNMSCDGMIMEIDDLMLPVVRGLTSKGYIVASSCCRNPVNLWGLPKDVPLYIEIVGGYFPGNITIANQLKEFGFNLQIMHPDTAMPLITSKGPLQVDTVIKISVTENIGMASTSLIGRQLIISEYMMKLYKIIMSLPDIS